MEKKFVSVIFYIHNDGKYLNDFFENVIEKIRTNYENYELICVDDACTDNSVDVLKEYAVSKNCSDAVSIVKMGSYQGLEASMNAGRDISIGDFVYEFDDVQVNYNADLVMDAFKVIEDGADISIVSPSGGNKLSSAFFYAIFNRYNQSNNKISSDAFRIISRRAINRIKSISDFVPYRKALYANCGLKAVTTYYKPTKKKQSKHEKKAYERFNLAFDSFVYFTFFLEHVSTAISAFFLLFSVGSVAYALWDHFTNNAIMEGWASIICFLSFGFFGVFVLLTIILKYLSVIVNLIFRRQKYLVESIEKIGV